MRKIHLLALSSCLIIILSGTAMAHEHGGKAKIKGKMNKMFDQTDANADGQLELSEFLSHAEQRFNNMDLNKDGYVTKEEGREAHKQMRDKRKAERKQKREERRQQREENSDS